MTVYTENIAICRRISLSEPGIKLEDLLNPANQAMLEAKRTGKNRVVAYESILARGDVEK